MFVNILLLIVVLLRLVIGVRLIAMARQNNLPNIYWLAAQFFTSLLSLLFAPTEGNPLGDLPISLWMFSIFGNIITASLVIPFNHTTFYRDRKSPLWWFVGVWTILTLLSLYGISLSESNYNQNPLLVCATFEMMIVVIWHGWAAYQALAGLSKEQLVEDWVKARYRLIVFYSVVVVIGNLASIIRVLLAGGSASSSLGSLMSLVSLLSQIILVVVQFLVWVMPEGYRRWLNRNQQVHTDERLAEQAQVIMNILGSAMSDGTGLTYMPALIAIRKMIEQEINTEDSTKISERAIAMRYEDWQALLKKRDLQLLVEGLGSNVNSNKVIENATRTLIKEQSLFTMQAK